MAERLDAAKLTGLIGQEHFYGTVSKAVDACREPSGSRARRVRFRRIHGAASEGPRRSSPRQARTASKPEIIGGGNAGSVNAPTATPRKSVASAISQ